MRPNPIITLLALLLWHFSANSNDLRTIDNNSFQKGEKISYNVYYDSWLLSNIIAGNASLEILQEDVEIQGRSAMHVVGVGLTRGLFNLFFKVDNRYETIIDEKAIAPLFFHRRIYEGGYEKNQTVKFDHFTNTAKSDTDTVTISPYVQDIISAFYYARTYDFSDAEIGDKYDVTFFLDDSVYVSQIKFDGREVIRTESGTYHTLRFKPGVQTGTVFRQPYPMTLWVTDDENKIPVVLQSGIIVGSIRMELSEYKGLKNPVSSRIN